ncbi:nucleotide disphospho-sugar-binding domain-containing protein [Streptomyces sp. NPDC007369]|uniref:nucleotide disphospho-sugar-binding domain-containing protein n=1 Tax=Streptomyces sp. NPDC007369 TaxID=3154589 RepID=UPI0034114786
MRILFITGGSPATVFALAPLASAARLAGHRVLVASPEDMTPYVTGTGLPAVSVTDGTMRRFMFEDRAGRPLGIPADPQQRIRFNGEGFGRLAAATLPALRSLAADWGPDLVVGGSLCYAAPLIAHELGVPWVRHTWDLGEPPEMDAGAAGELAAELAAAGLDALPVPRLWVDICPPGLRAPELAPGPRQSMRFVPYNLRRPLEPWMLSPAGRPRVCVTAGSRVAGQDEVAELTELARTVEGLDGELVVAAPQEVAAELARAVPGVRAGWFALDSLLDTCDLIVHHGGGQTAMTALHAGVPQLLVPTIPKMLPPCRRIADRGAGLVLPEGDQSTAAVAAAAAELLAAPAYRARAAEVAAEIASQPDPSHVVAELEALTGAEAARLRP